MVQESTENVGPTGTGPGTGADGSTGTGSGTAHRSQTGHGSGTHPGSGIVAPLSLPMHTRLGEFEVIDVIGEGGFSIVYLAHDHQLQRVVAIKEYLPGAIAYRNTEGLVKPRFEKYESTFNTGLQSFLKEARILAQFEHHSLIRIHRFWEQNGTAYMVMQYCQGKTLRQILQNDPSRGHDEPWLKHVMTPVLDALGVLHSRNCYHRDLSPDNIMILDSGVPMLLDFGAARQVIGDMTQALTVILKPGFAPIEQYADDESMRQGPWTDIYGAGAVLYFAVTGKAPTASVARLVKDPLKKLESMPDLSVSQPFAHAIDHALALFPNNRPQSVQEFAQELLVGDAPVTASAPLFMSSMAAPLTAHLPPHLPAQTTAPAPLTPTQPPAVVTHTEDVQITRAQPVMDVDALLAPAAAHDFAHSASALLVPVAVPDVHAAPAAHVAPVSHRPAADIDIAIEPPAAAVSAAAPTPAPVPAPAPVPRPKAAVPPPAQKKAGGGTANKSPVPPAPPASGKKAPVPPSTGGGGRRPTGLIIGGICALVVLLIAGALFAFMGGGNKPDTAVAQVTPNSTSPELAPPVLLPQQPDPSPPPVAPNVDPAPSIVEPPQPSTPLPPPVVIPPEAPITPASSTAAPRVVEQDSSAAHGKDAGTSGTLGSSGKPNGTAPDVTKPATPPVVTASSPASGASSVIGSQTNDPQKDRRSSSNQTAASETKLANEASTPQVGKPGAFLKLTVRPWGRVSIDGVNMGTSPPLNRLWLAEGEHHILIENADFQSYSAKVKITDKKDTSISHKFEQ